MFVGFYNIRIVHVIRARDINAPFPATSRRSRRMAFGPIRRRGEIYRFEASGQFNQRQFFIGFNSRLSRMFQFNGNYSFSKTTNDTDGQGGALFPMNSYDTVGRVWPRLVRYSASLYDLRHGQSAVVEARGESVYRGEHWARFNIITGQDLNLDRQVNERPSLLVQMQTARCRRSVARALVTSISCRCRVRRSFRATSARRRERLSSTCASAARLLSEISIVAMLRLPQTRRQTAAAGAGWCDRWRSSWSGGGGGGRESRPAGPQGGGGAAASEKRYNLNVSINFQNLFNHVNLGTPVGNLSSPSFGESLGWEAAFGGFGGGGGSAGAGNRRIYAQIRLNF